MRKVICMPCLHAYTAVYGASCGRKVALSPPCHVCSTCTPLLVQRRWDAICCLLVLYVALYLPVQLAFDHSSGFSWLRGISVAADLFFAVDVYVNLRTGLLLLPKYTRMILARSRLPHLHTYMLDAP